MKWIGQHIWSFISRFRSDVYFEDVSTSTGTSALVVDSDGKITKNDVADEIAITSDGGGLGATVDSGGRLSLSFLGGTGIATAPSSATACTISTSNIPFASLADAAVQTSEEIGEGFSDDDTSFLTAAAVDDRILSYGYSTTTGDITGVTAGTNLSGGGTSGAVTITLADASTSAKGAASFASADFDVSSGAVSLEGTVVKTVGSDSGSATPATHEFLIIGGEGIDTSGADENITISGEDASVTNKGIVELATEAEADTGTDTSRAVTPVGLKSHVDARYSYQYFHFSFKANNIPPDVWVSPSGFGLDYYLWNNTHGSGGGEPASDAPKDVDINTTIEIDYLDQFAALVVPHACVLDGFYGNSKTNGTNPNTLRPVMGIFRAAEPADGNTSDLTATCVAFDSYDTASGNRKNRFLKVESLGLNTALAQGDLLYPATGFDATASDSNGDMWGSYTIVLKTLVA